MENRPKILVIDDEEDFCFFVKANLENTGHFTVMTASNGFAGIRLCRSEKPDLVLLDISMPELSGEEVLDRLKERPETERIPVIFLTALITRREVRGKKYANLGGQIFVAKPVSTSGLVAAINSVLQRGTLKPA